MSTKNVPRFDGPPCMEYHKNLWDVTRKKRMDSSVLIKARRALSSLDWSLMGGQRCLRRPSIWNGYKSNIGKKFALKFRSPGADVWHWLSYDLHLSVDRPAKSLPWGPEEDSGVHMLWRWILVYKYLVKVCVHMVDGGPTGFYKSKHSVCCLIDPFQLCL